MSCSVSAGSTTRVDPGRLLRLPRRPVRPTTGPAGSSLRGRRAHPHQRVSAAGEVITQTAEMKSRQWDNPGFDRSKVRWTTSGPYDALGRIATMKYPTARPGLRLRPGRGSCPTSWGKKAASTASACRPRGTTSTCRDRQYDEFLRARYDRLGNSATTERTYDPDRQWLTGQRTVSPNRTVSKRQYTEIQDLKYTYDDVGNPLTYRNELPAPRSNLFGGATAQTYAYDPYERIATGSGEWQQASGKVRRHTFTIDYDENSNVTFKNQRDVIRMNNKDNVQAATTYSFNRSLRQPATTPGHVGRQHVVQLRRERQPPRRQGRPRKVDPAADLGRD